MDGNQNGTYGGEAPRTYGEESRLYEGGGASGNQKNSGQPSYGNQQNPYQHSYGNQQGPYQQSYGSQQSPYQQSYGSQQNPYQQPYGNQQNPYQQSYYGAPYGGMPHVQSTVNNIFCYILLVIMPLRVILLLPTLKTVFSYRLGYGSSLSDYMALASNRSYSVLSSLGNLLTIALIVFVILDIVNIHKAGYKITGLILFALFLNQGYYIWRAHVLRQKMTAPIIYTVAYALLSLVYFFYAFYLAFSMVLGMM